MKANSTRRRFDFFRCKGVLIVRIIQIIRTAEKERRESGSEEAI